MPFSIRTVNVCKHAVKWHHVSVYETCHQGVVRQEAGKGEGLEGKLSGDYLRLGARAVSRGQDELVGKFKMAASEVISIRVQVLEHT
jgi:hypothetical protein